MKPLWCANCTAEASVVTISAAAVAARGLPASCWARLPPLEHAGGYTPEEARRVARTLLPDLLPYDPMRPASFPDNGRTLTDDAVDDFLPILTNGKVTEDMVGPLEPSQAFAPRTRTNPAHCDVEPGVAFHSADRCSRPD
jgi:hypothetical protein